MVNPNEAPEGYTAVQYTGSCGDCSFSFNGCCSGSLSVSCASHNRGDNCDVYFIPKEEPKEMSHVDTQPVPSVIHGISLRDYFAGCAITGLLAADYHAVNAVVHAYEAADAMLQEREKSLNGGDNAANS